ncbi:MAG TPA: hypothetical protein VFE60_11720 [Roseiarcus sp.]|jgi:hypothetical protein|nr:hypothetical protein [Roseiarcus sp.]
MAARKRTKDRLPRSRGEWGLSVPDAGALVGLSINASYAAAKRGEIPTVKIGSLLIVPRAAWLRKLGLQGEADRELELQRQEAADRARKVTEKRERLLAELEALNAAY